MHDQRLENIKAAPPPADFAQLKLRLDAILGKTLAALAGSVGAVLPESALHGKGFTGELLELILGASAGNLSEPDFPGLALELKTMPVDENLKPLESTFITHAPLLNIRGLRFEDTALYHKLRRVLFVFVTAPREMPFAERTVAGYRFWAPDPAEMGQIRADYEELMELVATGRISEVSAKIGTVIQMRPKAADGRALTDCIGPDGSIIKTRPRGFYMRRSFTAALIEKFRQGRLSQA